MEKELRTIEKKADDICKVILSRLAVKFKEVRKQKKISIREFSELSSVSTAVISDFENKKYLPKLEILVRFALALDVPIEELLSTMTPSGKVINAVSCDDENELLSLALLSTGVSSKMMLEIMDFIAFKTSKFDRRNFQE